jgi:magnesium chelatase family protein
MLAKVYSGTTIGLEGVLIEVEVDVAGKGFPTFTIVGLPNKAVDEAKDRVRTAISNISFEMPDSRLTVNLAPAHIPKEGSTFDLPIAVGVLAASRVIEVNSLHNSLFVGELSLQGAVRKVPGVVAIALMARKRQIKHVFVPAENCKEAAMIPDIQVFPVQSLQQLVLHLNKLTPIPEAEKTALHTKEFIKTEVDFADIYGQEAAKRVLEISAAGFHNVHLKGVPGAGKTMLSRAFGGILPPLDAEEILELTKIYSIAGLLGDNQLISTRPFRSPHHTTSRIGLIGGGKNPLPGEVTLAHRGVLFLDEFPEFPRSVLESLRQPLEDGVISIARAAGRIQFPSRFILLAASNPCPCGFLGHPKKSCRCSPTMILNYKKRLSGPLLDRIDLHIMVPPVDEDKLTTAFKAEETKSIQKRVIKARERQDFRFKDTPIRSNSEMTSSLIKMYCSLTDKAQEVLKQAVSRLSLSARSYFKILKVARTIADLKDQDTIDVIEVGEALQYRVNEE